MRHTTLPAQPAPVGPDVVYLDSQFVAYANGTQIEGFENSQAAWNAARAAVFAPVVPVSPVPAVTVTRHTSDEDPNLSYTIYECGGVHIFDDGDGGFDVSDLVDLDVFAQTFPDTRTVRGYTDLTGLGRLWAALDAIVTRIEQDTQPRRKAA